MTASTKQAAPSTTPSTPSSGKAIEPIIVDMGKGSRKELRKLRKGKQGKLLQRVEETLEYLRESGALSEGAQPIVIVVREKSRKRAANLLGLG